MHRSKLHFFFIVLLAIYFTQNDLVKSTKRKRSLKERQRTLIAAKKQNCLDEIQGVFPTTNYQQRTYIARYAFLNLRTSFDPSDDFFIIDNASSSNSNNPNYTVKTDAKAYFDYILPFIVIIGNKMDDPYKFCERYEPDEYPICIAQLSADLDVSRDTYAVLKSIYHNIVLDQLTAKSEFTIKYVNEFAENIQPTSDMELPKKFCSDRYTKNEISNN